MGCINDVSMPGHYFLRGRNIWELPKNVERLKITTLQLAFLVLCNERLERPHNGIVDEASNHLARCEGDIEKLDSYRSPRARFPKHIPDYA
jgi:hypothetical protein